MREWFSIDTATTWGDYWSILIGGMTGHLPRAGEQLQLERTGPFVPPMVTSGIGDLIVTESMRDLLRSVSGVQGFRSVLKARIVRLDWSAWKLDGDCPELVRFREPEDTVLSGKHDPKLAQQIGEIYEVLLKSDGTIRRGFDDDGFPLNTFLKPPKHGFDLFAARTIGGYHVPIATMQFVSSLKPECKQWLEFNRVGPELR